MPRYKNKPTKKSNFETELRIKQPNQQEITAEISAVEAETSETWVSSSNLSSTATSTIATPQPSPPPSPKKVAELEIGTINLKLHIPGLVDLIIPVPAPETVFKTQHINAIFKEFENKYWCNINKPCSTFKCLICEASFQRLHSIQTHVAKHIGLPLARCTKCGKNFFSLATGEHHIKNCSD